MNLLKTGKSFHDPMHPVDRYEFLGHIRYFTYRTLKEVVEDHGFVLDTVYLAAPQASSKFRALWKKSRLKAMIYRTGMLLMYRLASPRWASEPVLCFKKGDTKTNHKVRKIIL